MTTYDFIYIMLLFVIQAFENVSIKKRIKALEESKTN